MALESLPKISPANFSPENDLIQVYSKKGDYVGVINPSYIKSSPSGVSGAIQFSDGSAFASDASNLFWDDTNNRLGVGTPSPTAKVNIVDNVGGTGNALLISHPTAPATLSYNPNASALILSGGYSYLAINTFGGGSNALTLGSGGPHGYLDLKENGTTYVSLSGTSTGNAGYSYFLSQLGVGTATTLGAKMNIKGSGSTSATTSLLVQNSAGTQLMKVQDDSTTIIRKTSFLTYGLQINDTSGGVGGISLTGTPPANNQLILAAGCLIKTSTTFGSTTGAAMNFGTAEVASTSGDVANFEFAGQANMQSGNASFSQLKLTPNFTTGGTYSGIARGVYYAPSGSLTGVTSHYAWQNTSGAMIVNSSTPNASAILQADSTTQGFLPPRMTDAQIRAIVSPANGLVAYNTDINHLCCYQNGAWAKFSHSPM
jgi:hypothetical protein